MEQIKNLDVAKALYGRDIFEKAMKDTDDDIKLNRISFNKTTSAKQYMEIFYICLRKGRQAQKRSIVHKLKDGVIL